MLGDTTIRKAVQFAIGIEVTGEKLYTNLAERFSEQQELSEAFSILAKDEKAHGDRFKVLLDELPPEYEITSGEDDYRYLIAMARSELFGNGVGLAVALEKVQSIAEVLTRVLDFEKDTLGFYRAIQDILGKNEALDAIIEEEKKHVTRIAMFNLTEEKLKQFDDDS